MVVLGVNPIIAADTAEAAVIRQKPAVDSTICAKDQLLTIVKCNNGTLVTCGEHSGKTTYSCNGEGLPERFTPAPKPALPPGSPPSTKTVAPPPKPRVVLVPSRPKVIVIPEHHLRHRYYRHRSSFRDFFKQLFHHTSR